MRSGGRAHLVGGHQQGIEAEFTGIMRNSRSASARNRGEISEHNAHLVGAHQQGIEAEFRGIIRSAGVSLVSPARPTSWDLWARLWLHAQP